MSRPDYGEAPGPGDAGRVFDACVVGSGASGAVVAWLLARAGLDVLVVEQGPHVGDLTYDDVVAASEPAWARQHNGTWARVGYPWTTCNVGGGTVFYAGVSFRHRPVDFDAGRALGRTGLPLAWPWSPDDLDPYYTAVEHLLGVAGQAGADPTLPVHAPYPLPPVPASPEGAVLAEAARRRGLSPFPTPLAVATRDYGGRPRCTGTEPCVCRACPTGAKGDVVATLLRPARARGLRLLAGLKATRLVPGTGARVEALECVRVDTGATYRFRARHFVVCANAVQTPALLLRSEGLPLEGGGPGRGAGGGAGGLVGAGLCFKLGGYLVGYRRCAGEGGGDAPRGGGPFSTVTVSDHYEDPQAPGGLGGLVYEAQPERTYHLRPGEQILRLECLVPDEPQAHNRVRLARETDGHGVPEVVMDYQAHPRDLVRLEYMLDRGEELLREAGCTTVVREESGWELGSAHLHGTCRSGSDPATSVTTPDGLVRGVDNLSVADGSLMPFPGAVNPTLTIQALALRVAHRLLADRFGTEVALPARPDGAQHAAPPPAAPATPA